MTKYKVITQKYKQQLDMKLAKEQQAKYTCQEGPGQYTIYTWKCSKKEQMNVLDGIVDVLHNLVQEEVMNIFAKRYLKTCDYLEDEEKKEIKKRFVLGNPIDEREGVSSLSYYLIYVPIKHMLEDEQSINIEGWINFRTQRYQSLLEDMMEQAIYDYRTQKDYFDILEILIESKYLGENNEESLHIITDHTHKIYLLNEAKEDITDQYIEKYCSDLLDEEIEKEDFVMNILLSVSPQTIYIHNKKQFYNQQFVETLEKVFEGQIVYCQGCKCCQKEDH